VRARAPVVRGRLWPGGALKDAKKCSCGSRLPSTGLEGSVPPPGGFLRGPPPSALNTSWSALRAWLEPWPCTGAPLVVPNSVARGQLSNPGRGPAFAPSRLIPGSGPVSAVETPSLTRTRSIRVPAVFCCVTLTLLFRKKEEGWRTPYYPRLGEFR
jgi:hypothetical protein